jgi:hypothetical protein
LACESEISDASFDDCAQWWHNLTHWFRYGDALAGAIAAHAANRTCGKLDGNQRSSVTHNATLKSAQMERLRRLDQDYLGGVLAQAEAVVGCPVSSNYSPTGRR